MYRDLNSNGIYDEGTDIPISGGVVRSPEALSYIVRTKPDGRYATYSWAMPDIDLCPTFRITGIDLVTQKQKNWASSICVPPFEVKKDFTFNALQDAETDREAPKLVVNVTSTGGFVSGITKVGSTVTIDVRVSDNREVDLQSVFMDMNAPGIFTPTLQHLGDLDTTEIVNGLPRTVYFYRATFEASAVGTYTFRLHAKDTALPIPNNATRTITFSVVDQNINISGIPGPPHVLDGGVFPGPGSTNLTGYRDHAGLLYGTGKQCDRKLQGLCNAVS